MAKKFFFILFLAFFVPGAFNVIHAQVDSRQNVLSVNEVGVGPTAEQLNAIVGRSINKAISQKDPDYRKHIGLLPDSRFYFLKSGKETIAQLFLFGNKKTAYLVKLSQKRLIETYLMEEKGQTQKFEKSLIDYTKIMKKIGKSNINGSLNEIAWNLKILNSFRLILSENANYAHALEVSAQLAGGAI